MRKIKFASLASLFVLMAWCLVQAEDGDGEDGNRVILDSKELTESSGLAFSNRDPSCVWSHNDSGDEARLFAFDANSGAWTGQWRLNGVRAIDWEDMTIIGPSDDSPARIIVADCGDNQRRRDQIELHVFNEPDPRAHGQVAADSIRTIRVVYPNGARDCEAVAYDPVGEQVILIAKSVLPWAGVYGVNLATVDEAIVTAEELGTVPIAMATAAEINASTGDLWVATYWHAMCFKKDVASKQNTSSWSERFRQTPTNIAMPPLKQIEALGLDREGRIHVTSEGAPTPLIRIATQP